MNPAEGTTADEGVLYQAADYAGFWRRLAIDLIDVAVVAVLASVILALFVNDEQLVDTDAEKLIELVFPLVALPVGFAYFVLLKRFFRTLGYIVCRARIVNVQGMRPSIYALTIRLLFAVFGPFNVLLDLIWITSDRYRQALRDKFAHTYVVRSVAVPTGHGRVVYRSYYVMGASFLFAEIEANERPGAAPAAS